MKITLALALLIVTGAFAGAYQAAQTDAARRPAANKSPFACDRLALSPAARARHFGELGPALRKLVAGVRELPRGYAFQVPTDRRTALLVAEWIAGERLCCPFFDLVFRVDREGGPAWLILTGRPGTKQFIQSDLAAWMAR